MFAEAADSTAGVGSKNGGIGAVEAWLAPGVLVIALIIGMVCSETLEIMGDVEATRSLGTDDGDMVPASGSCETLDELEKLDRVCDACDQMELFEGFEYAGTSWGADRDVHG